MWVIETIIDFLGILDPVSEEYHSIFKNFSFALLISVAISLYVLLMFVVTYIWSSILIFKIYKNKEKNFFKYLTYIPIFNFFAIGHLSNHGRRKEHHYTFFALIFTMIISFSFNYYLVFDLMLFAMIVHLFDSVKNIVVKYNLNKKYQLSFIVAPFSLPLILSEVEKKENK